MLTILRLSHRIKRDERVSTHCALVARAFGADKLIYYGQKDENLENSIKKVSKQWGGTFKIKYEKNWKKTIENFKGKKIHLTIYGESIKKKIKEIRKNKNILIIIGGKKVPGEIYNLADYNIAITNQPHSEIAALSIFLHEYFQGKEKTFKGKLKIIPQKKGKKIQKL
jgi:tRNA (cytidine56-2'-O)-methyltransferase